MKPNILQLGNLTLKNCSILSPMEAVSDVGFRNLCFSAGASLSWTEMIRADGILKNNKATLDLIDTYDECTQSGVQILAKCPRKLERALMKLESLSTCENHAHFRNIAAIDLNFGCPSPAVIQEGAGPALLKRKKRIIELLGVLVDWKRNTTLSKVGAVGCKIRLGLSKEEENSRVYMNVVDAANHVGIDYMVVHARHAQQRSSQAPNWDAIREVKQNTEIPIIGNGDVNGSDDAVRMMQQTGCDGVMIARAAIRNPWVFREFSGDLGATPTLDEVATAKRDYMNWAAKCGTKPKYSSFHQSNFDRLESNVKSGIFLDRVYKFRIPKNSHM